MEVLFFLAGLVTGLITWWISERRVRREPYQKKLAEFLLPLQNCFIQTELIADFLRGDLADLEYPHLVAYFEGLPESDPRRFNWRQRIERLHALNSEAIQLISEKGGGASSQLAEALNRFRSHAMDWEDIWDALKEGEVPATEEVRASPFPEEVRKALEREIADTKERAGRI